MSAWRKDRRGRNNSWGRKDFDGEKSLTGNLAGPGFDSRRLHISYLTAQDHLKHYQQEEQNDSTDRFLHAFYYLWKV